MPTAESIRIAREYLEQHAKTALTENQAKLYSQSIRRQMGRDGLVTFGQTDIDRALEEAFLLIQYALLFRGENVDAFYLGGLKRAAEILEWLSQADLRPAGSPLHLLSAGAYQLSGYPAMALGELKRLPEGEFVSDILVDFLRADFPAVLRSLNGFWEQEITTVAALAEIQEDLSVVAIQHVIRCLGTVVEYLRFGENDMIERAISKLDKLAAGFLHSRDPYSALLAKLVGAVAHEYHEMSLWQSISELQASATEETSAALSQFARAQFVNRRALIWPAQKSGILRLQEGASFVLCTPTGSGKTTVATLGIIPALFEPNPNLGEGLGNLAPGNLVLYLVPSRALAAEIEERLDQDLRGISAQRIIVTGLYGGTDWGPTDAWIAQDRPTILICTFEKADALLRYVGILFLNRVRLVIIDEAHNVNYSKPEPEALQEGTSRPYRLELLGTRLGLARERYNFRTIALSAVAAYAAPSLARWISGTDNAEPTESLHRSTRQMFGRLEVNAHGGFTIKYDLMNGQSLKFNEGNTQSSPYVGEPFPRMPGRIGSPDQPEIRMRAPTLWAALNLASERTTGTKPTVLISITQKIDEFAKSCLEILDGWQDLEIPNYFEADLNQAAFNECLASVADYFSEDSFEYRLLTKGIVLHHAKLPSAVGRRLKFLINSGTIRVVIATSTLSEGVNIPVNYILLPSVFRGQARLGLPEFSNLIGRAGRPGVATEGHALVVLATDSKRSRYWSGYEQLRDEMDQATSPDPRTEDAAHSPLVALITAIDETWRRLNPFGTEEDFERWLEQTAVITAPDNESIRNLDSLDYFLLCALEEVEQLTDGPLVGVDLESALQRIWRSTYAHASVSAEERLSAIWLSRGVAIPELYQDRRERARIYKTSLTPRSANTLLTQVPLLLEQIRAGADYASWSTEQRFTFIANMISSLDQVPSFRLDRRLGHNRGFTDWRRLLQWWMCKNTLEEHPSPKQITKWFDYVSKNFIYRSSWGLGSLIAVVLNDNDFAPIRPMNIDDWPRAGLPWIAFWMKELFTWGTLEPVAAFLLARGDTKTRGEAEQKAQEYYDSRPASTYANDLLDPRAIRVWAQETRPSQRTLREPVDFEQQVRLTRERDIYRYQQVYVTPIVVNGGWTWIDKAGYDVAKGPINEDVRLNVEQYEFTLDVSQTKVTGRQYLAYQLP